MTDTALPSAGPWMALLSLDGDPIRWAASVASLSAECDSVMVVAHGTTATEAKHAFQQYPNVHISHKSVAATMAQWTSEVRAFLMVLSPAILPADALLRADLMLEQDLRLATVSFFSNDADYLSVPKRNQPQLLAPPGHTESSITTLLRAERSLHLPVPIPVPAGPAVAISAAAVRALGPPTTPPNSPDYAIVDFALRANHRSMRSVLDPATYVLRIPGGRDRLDTLNDHAARTRLQSRFPFFPAAYDDIKQDDEAPVACSIGLARSVIEGLSVLVDGTSIGPFENGTQVQILNLVRSLSSHPSIKRIVLGLIGSVPPYALDYIASPKVEISIGSGYKFNVADRVNILHRPCQPDEYIPWQYWRRISDRIVVTVQDLIAFNNGSYFVDSVEWRNYRNGLRHSIRSADGVIVISEDVARDMRLEQMAIPSEILRVIPNGVDHSLGENLAESTPAAVLVNDFAASPFILLLGASYAHKNRDVAIRAWRLLKNRGHHVRLILAGVTVPYGSTRNEEAQLLSELDESQRCDILVLPDVTSAERMWLLTHASIVLYPTTAEGFGLIPFEAAQCGTPTLFVSFGPLAELLSTVPITAEDWSPECIADSLELLLSDPALAQAQVDSVKMLSAKFTWDSTADEAVSFYRELLARPPMRRIDGNDAT